MSPAVLTLDSVSVSYPIGPEDVLALDGVSLKVEAGSSTAIMGRSGAGKSTLVAVLSLLRRPTQGTVAVGGHDTAGMGDAQLSALRAATVGTVFQSFHLDPSLSAEVNVMLPWFFSGALTRRAARARARDLLELMDIADLTSRRPGEMSGGQRQRVAIARALFSEPAVLLADEPTGNLDEGTASAVADVIFSLPTQLSTAVVVVTHDGQVAKQAESVLQISQGRFLTVATEA